MKDSHCCKICGKTDFVNAHEWVNYSRCYNCKRIKNGVEYSYSLNRSKWGTLCEDHVAGMSKNDISDKYRVVSRVVKDILDKYYGIYEKPLLLEFKAKEDTVINHIITPLPVGRRVRITDKGSRFYGVTREILETVKVKEGYKYRLKHSGNKLYWHEILELTAAPKQSVSFNI